jgi:hypothetical protein
MDDVYPLQRTPFGTDFVVNSTTVAMTNQTAKYQNVWDTRILYLTTVEGGNDTLLGGSGCDFLYGQVNQCGASI